MATIESINAQYVSLLNDIDQVHSCEGKIASIKRASADVVDKIKECTKSLANMVKKADSILPNQIPDVLTISKLYLECTDAIDEFEKCFLNNASRARILNSAACVSSAQSRFAEEKEVFQKKYNCSIESDRKIVDIIATSVKSAGAYLLERLNAQKNKAIEFLNKKESVDLRASGTVKQVNTLPDKMLVARFPVDKTSMLVLRDIGATNVYTDVYANLREQGNTIVQLAHEQMSDERLDDFVLSYIFRFIEAFPAGNVNVHLFDVNTGFLYKRLSNAFQGENAGEQTKRTIKIYDDMRDLTDFRRVFCDDIFNKTSTDSPDLFSIYNHDQTDPFTLVVLKDGLVNGSGYALSDILDTILTLSKPGDIGHKCGVRFLILNNSKSFESDLAPNVKRTIDQIEQNCELKLNFAEGEYALGEQKIEVLHIDGDRDAYVQHRAQELANIINNKEKNYVALEDVSANAVVEDLGPIMYIPVGKTGNSAVELPFSCKDEKGTVAGQCIGYMAIGQSGSGKSSFFHSLVLNGCMKYSPKDLQFWLLDFKNGGASSKYRDSGLPHIKMIAENNKLDDALCLFQMVLEEMERRNKAFNANGTDNIVDYNEIAKARDLDYFPRTIIAIDEVQEIFRDDSASVIQKQISSISTRMRSAGMHFVMVAQNLSDGKSYMLKDAFLPSATGRICFRVAQDIPRDSGFEEEFIQRKQEIAELKTGEAYVGYGKDTIKKVKMAYTSPQEMSNKYFADIRSKYPSYVNQKPFIIGSKVRISINSCLQGQKVSYFDVMKEIAPVNGVFSAVIGEDAYRMTSLKVNFSQNENSSVLLLGSDKQISSSLCTSIVLSLMRQSVPIHLFNGDRTKVQDGVESYPHALMYICQNLGDHNKLVKNHRMNEFGDVLSELYREYLQRQARVQEADDEDPLFEPVFLVVNDLFAIESFSSNSIVECGKDEKQEIDILDESYDFKYEIIPSTSVKTNNQGRFQEGTQNIVATLVKNGWRYNMHIVLAIKGDPSVWRSSRVVTEVNSVSLFNTTDYAEQFSNSYYLKEMLKNISNDGEPETLAVWASHRVYSKIRPFIYRISDEQERFQVDALLKEAIQ